MTSESVGSWTKTRLGQRSVTEEPGEDLGNLQIVLAIEGDIVRHINGEPIVASSMGANLFAIDKHCGVVVHGLEVEKHAVVVPVLWHLEFPREPHMSHIETLNA